MHLNHRCNLFKFFIASEPIINDPALFGYSFQGGGYVADRMIFFRNASALSPYNSVLDIVFDITTGLGTLPKIGAMKITYNPTNSEWKLYYQVGSQKVDPVLITNLIGTGINNGFVNQNLPYLILVGQETGSTFFDHFTVLINRVP